MGRFETRRSRIGLIWVVAIVLVCLIFPAVVGIVQNSFQSFFDGVLTMLGFTIFVIAIVGIIELAYKWVYKGKDSEKKDNGDLTDIMPASDKSTHEAMPAATLINILEMWPGSAEVWVRSVHTQEMHKVDALHYDRDYNRIIIREVED